MSNPFFSLSLSHESDEVVILSEARVAKDLLSAANDLLAGRIPKKQVLRACGAQDDMLAAFAVIEEGRICG